MPPLLNKPPKLTIFHINPKSGEPYMTVQYATNLIKHHVSKFAFHLLHNSDMEDLVQYFLLRLCISVYKPKKAAPMTFAMMNIYGTCGSLAKMNYRKKVTAFDQKDANGKVIKYKGITSTIPATIMRETIYSNDDDSVTSSLDIRPDTLTPLDYLLTKETLSELGKDQVPEGYIKSRNCKQKPPLPKSKVCSGPCGKRFLRSLKYFHEQIQSSDGLWPMCRKCHNRKSRLYNRKKRAIMMAEWNKEHPEAP